VAKKKKKKKKADDQSAEQQHDNNGAPKGTCYGAACCISSSLSRSSYAHGKAPYNSARPLMGLGLRLHAAQMFCSPEPREAQLQRPRTIRCTVVISISG
jgi:hypothetical protein